MTDRDDSTQNPVSYARNREHIAWVASRVRDYVAERVEQLFATAVEQFLDVAGNARNQSEQVHFFDAYKILRREQPSLGNALRMAVDYNFRELERPSRQVANDEDDLSLQLVANDILEEMITLDNMVSKVIARCGKSMEFLTARLGSVVGRTLSEHDNPLVPEFLCESFSRQIAALKLDFEPKIAIYRIFESVMLKDWPALVEECNDRLRELGVLPDLEKRRPAIKKTEALADPSDKGSIKEPHKQFGPFSGPDTAFQQGRHDAPRQEPSNHSAARYDARRSADDDGTAGDTSGAAGSGRTGASSGNGHAGGSYGETADSGFATAPQGGSNPQRPANVGPGAGAFAQRGPGAANHSGDVLADLERFIRERSSPDGASPGAGESPAAGAVLDADQLAKMFSHWRQGRDREQFLAELSGQGLEGALETILATNNHGPESLRNQDRGLLRVLDRTFTRLNETAHQQHEANLLLNLELPAAWMALKDPLFLERQNHPGRRLINELCRVNSTLGGEESSVDPLRRKVDEIVERLNAFDVTLRQLSQLLTDLIDVIEKDKRTTGLREERVLQEADSQARLAQAHEQVLQILTERLVGRRWPGFLVSFCEKAWSRVLFLAGLRHGIQSQEWRQALSLLDRLLVLASARRAMADADRIEFVAAIEAELLHIGYDAVESRRYLDSLASFLASLGDKAGAGGEQAGGGRENDAATDALAVDLPGQRPDPDDVPEDLDPETLAFVDALRRGAWVEFRDGDKSLRCKLAGTIKASSKLVFTNRRGIKVAEEHRHRMAVKMQEGKVIVLDNSHLFDQAYGQVINEVQFELRSQANRVG